MITPALSYAAGFAAPVLSYAAGVATPAINYTTSYAVAGTAVAAVALVKPVSQAIINTAKSVGNALSWIVFPNNSEASESLVSKKVNTMDGNNQFKCVDIHDRIHNLITCRHCGAVFDSCEYANCPICGKDPHSNPDA